MSNIVFTLPNMPVFYYDLGSPFAYLTAERIDSLFGEDRKSTRLNSSHTEIYTLSLHDALPIYVEHSVHFTEHAGLLLRPGLPLRLPHRRAHRLAVRRRSEEHTSELQSHRDLHSFPTRRSSDLCRT